MDSSVSGQHAEATYRVKTGKRMSREEEYLKSQQKDEKPKEIKLEWGKGLAQKREAEPRLEKVEAEKEKSICTKSDDPEVDAQCSRTEFDGATPWHIWSRKKPLDSLFPDLGDSEKMKACGFIIPQEVPTHSWIRRGTDAALNRYGIKPGRHWDGVDCSSGYEEGLFKTRMNGKRATDAEAYKWSVSDM